MEELKGLEPLRRKLARLEESDDPEDKAKAKKIRLRVAQAEAKLASRKRALED